MAVFKDGSLLWRRGFGVRKAVAPKPADTFRLGPASLAEMVKPRVPAERGRSWALGWEIDRDIIRHSGGNPGSCCFVAASPSRKSGYVIMTNSDGGVELLRQFAPDVSRALHSAE